MSNDRRVNMYFSENKIIDNTIYEYFKNMNNKQDIIRMVLYEYVMLQNGDSFGTGISLKSYENNPSSKNVTRDSQKSEPRNENNPKSTQGRDEELKAKKLAALNNFL